jgi:hypothetical protein
MYDTKDGKKKCDNEDGCEYCPFQGISQEQVKLSCSKTKLHPEDRLLSDRRISRFTDELKSLSVSARIPARKVEGIERQEDY